MKIYTRSGDHGKTSVIGARVDKDDCKIEAYGTIDELNSFVALAAATLSAGPCGDLQAPLTEIQHELFDCGADLAYAESGKHPFKVNAEMVKKLEGWIDRYTEECPPIKKFILPGGSEPAALFHVCRTVCRRAERQTVALSKREDVNPEVLRYLNRLSDLFFVLARVANVRLGVADVAYVRSADVF
ncbi:MAG TPA: cob(I)yrinic acid a,c-diamide adenosyltransferase [Bacilli bacterium]